MAASAKSNPAPKNTSGRRPTAPRPDQMSNELCEFLTAIDDFRRAEQRSALSLEDVLVILSSLGYDQESRKADPHDADTIEVLVQAVETYKKDNERLFPNWSEIFRVARNVGWDR